MKKLSLTTKVVYSLPQFTNNILNGFIGNHLTLFYVNDLCTLSRDNCLSTKRFGTLSSIIGSLGLFLDLFISSFVDSSQRNDRQLPLIAFTAPLLCLANVALFNVHHLQFITSALNFTRSPLLSLSLFFTLFSVIRSVSPLNIAYNTLGQTITKDCSLVDRNSLFVYKHMFSLSGDMVGAFLPSLVIYLLGSDKGSSWYSNYVTILSLVSLLTYWLMCLYLRSPKQSPKQQTGTVSHSPQSSYTMIPNMRYAFRNKAFVALLSLFIYEAIRGMLWGGLYPFYLSQVVGLNSAQIDFWEGVFNVTGMILAMVSTPLWQKISARLGNYCTWLLAYALQIPVGTFVFLLIGIGQQQVYRYYIFKVILCIIGSGSGFLFDSIKANAVDYEEFRTGQSRSASFEACWNLFPRYISLFSNAFSFSLVSRYNTLELESRGEYTYEAKLAISVLATLLPSLTSIGCLYLMYRFPVTDKKHSEISVAKQEKKSGKQVRDPVTNEPSSASISISKEQEEESNCINHFFEFELKYYRSGSTFPLLVDRTLFLLWNLMSIFCGYSFIKAIVSDNDRSDHLATIHLWLSSVSFTIAYGFHYSRIKMAPRLITILQAKQALKKK